MMLHAEQYALTDSSLTETLTVKNVISDVKNASVLEFARNAVMDLTYIKVNALRIALLDTTENVKKEFAKNVTMPARSAQTTLPPTVNTAQKISSLTETLASNLITVDKEHTLMLLPENALPAEFPSALSA
jgi:hypothetical protein